MLNNFRAMPAIVKLCTVAALGVMALVVTTKFPHISIHVGDRQITTAEWWNIGAGPFMLVVGLLMVSSAVMMLKRSRHARLAYAVAWSALCISVPFVSGVSGLGVAASKLSVI